MNYSILTTTNLPQVHLCVDSFVWQMAQSWKNAAIYSHANYLANGNLTDRITSEPVVTATGNVTIKGKVFIKGDDGGSDIGQTALRVSTEL